VASAESGDDSIYNMSRPRPTTNFFFPCDFYKKIKILFFFSLSFSQEEKKTISNCFSLCDFHKENLFVSFK